MVYVQDAKDFPDDATNRPIYILNLPSHDQVPTNSREMESVLERSMFGINFKCRLSNGGIRRRTKSKNIIAEIAEQN